jgi:hypothetical protein
MSIIKFIQIGCTVRNGSPTLLNMIGRAKIPYAVSFMYISSEVARGSNIAPYGFHENITIVMVEKQTLEDRVIAYSQVKDKKIIIVLPAGGTQREFNLGIAVGSAPLLKPGIYIADKGKVSEWAKYNLNT